MAQTTRTLRRWASEYDWHRCEARLNALPQFTMVIDGVRIHFIHVRSRHENALPMIMTHGWPGSVIEFLESIGPLTDPTSHDGTADDAFHLVLPSLPGYGFSSEPTELGWDSGRIARAWAELDGEGDQHSGCPVVGGDALFSALARRRRSVARGLRPPRR